MNHFLFLISLPEIEAFEVFKPHVEECIALLRERGAVVRTDITPETLADATQYDAVIIIAHHEADTDRLMLASGPMPMEQLADALPADFAGVLDLSSCHSITAFNLIKERCPGCRVQVAGVETSLLVRLFLYPYLIELLEANPGMDYYDGYNTVLDMMIEAQQTETTDDEGGSEGEDIYLGQPESTIYAPVEVKRGSDFIVQVFLYYDDETGRASIQTKISDCDAKEWEPGPLMPIDLHTGDKVKFTIDFLKDNYYIHAEKNEEEMLWQDKTNSVQFIVSVSSNFPRDTFLTRISISYGEQQLKAYTFKTKVTGMVAYDTPPLFNERDKSLRKKIKEEIKKNNNTANYYARFNHMPGIHILFGSGKEEDLPKIRTNLCKNNLYQAVISKHINEQIGKCDQIIHLAEDVNEPALKEAVNVLCSRAKVSYRKGLEQYHRIYNTFRQTPWLHFEANERNSMLETKFPDIETDFLILMRDIQNNYCHLKTIEATIKLSKSLSKLNPEPQQSLVNEFYQWFVKFRIDKPLFDLFQQVNTETGLPTLSAVSQHYQGLAYCIALGKKLHSVSPLYSTKEGEEEEKKVLSHDSEKTMLSRANKIYNAMTRKDSIYAIEIKKYYETNEGCCSIIAYRLLHA